jgi:type I restriction enzyme M protein
MRLAEFDVEKEWWTKRQESERTWKVSASDIAKNNYNLDIKNPNAPVEVHDDPDELLRQYHEAVKKVSSLQNQLKANLRDSLK